MNKEYETTEITLDQEWSDRLLEIGACTEFIDSCVDYVLRDLDDVDDDTFIRLSNAVDVRVYDGYALDHILGELPVLSILERIVLDDRSDGVYECGWNYAYDPTTIVIGSVERARYACSTRVRRTIIGMINNIIRKYLRKHDEASVGALYINQEAEVLSVLYPNLQEVLLQIMRFSAVEVCRMYGD